MKFFPFTKDELIKLKNGLDYLPQSVNLSLEYYNECVLLMKRIDVMISYFDDRMSDERIETIPDESNTGVPERTSRN